MRYASRVHSCAPKCFVVGLEYMEASEAATPNEGQRKPRYTKEQYRDMSKWFERIGIGTLGSVVAQRLISGSNLVDPFVVVGVS